MTFKRYTLVSISTLACAATLAAPAFAAAIDAQAGTGGAASAPAGGRPAPGGAIQTSPAPAVSEIVVTANKRPERILEVAGAISALRGSDLLNSGTDSIRDIVGVVPGLQFNNGLGSGAPIIRGLSEGIDTSPTVATVVDGAPIGSSSSLSIGAQDTLDLDPIDIERVEVLKGPQGTLYGANTLGGLISYALSEPNLTHAEGIARGELDGTQDGGPSYSARGAFSTPLIQDQLALRLSGFYDQRGGFIDNDARNITDENRQFSWGGRIGLLYRPNDKLRVSFNGLYQTFDNTAGDVALYNFGTQKPVEDLKYNQHVLPNARKQIGAAIVNIDYDLGFANLTSVTSYQHIHSHNDQNLAESSVTATFADILPLLGGEPFPTPALAELDRVISTSKETQELRLTSPQTQRLSWIVGGFFTHESNDYNADFIGRETNGQAAPGLNPFFVESLDSSLKEYSGFVNVTYKILPVLDVTGGFRIGEIDQRYQQFLSGADVVAYNTLLEIGGLSPVPVASVPATSSETVKTYLATARYHFSPDGILFLRYATGFRPGGPNTVTPGLPPTFNPDTTQNYEAGVKSRFWGGRGTIDLTGYYTEWRNIVVVTTSGGFAGYTNGGNADIAGAEGALSLRPIPPLTISATGAYSNGRIREAFSTAGGALGRDDTLPYDPKWTGSLSAEYRTALTQTWNGYLSGTLRYSDSRNAIFASNTATPNYVMPSYGLLDIHVGAERGNYMVDVFAKNVNNEHAQLAANTFFGLAEVTVARPRTIGIAFTAKY